jgi:hypothetical protein
MKHLFFFYLIAFWVATHTVAHAQTPNKEEKAISKNLLVGLNPTRTFFHFLASGAMGYSIEPEIKYRMGRVAWGGTFGVSQYQAPLKGIRERFIKGHYFELGIDGFVSTENFERVNGTGFSLSLHYVQSLANETGSFYLGNSFGDYYQPYSRRNIQVRGLKLGLNAWIRKHKKIQMVISPRFVYTTAPNITTYNQYPFAVPLNYMVGLGVITIRTNDDKACLALGCDIRLFYNFSL